LNDLSEECAYFFKPKIADKTLLEKHLDTASIERLKRFSNVLSLLKTWDRTSISETFKPFCEQEGIKMPQLGMPLRLALCGTTQTPSVDSVLEVMGKERVLHILSILN
jgi:glutamyl-tRNA synthetase